ncbi:MAG: hypothetical protein WCZ90_12045 [Melioribacteraceae bacterium]
MYLKKYVYLIAVLAIAVIFPSCKGDQEVVNPPSGPEMTQLRGAYLGQTAPGMVPTKFIPNDLFRPSETTWWYHGSPVFSPDGNEMYFVKYSNVNGAQIWFTKSINGQWTAPQRASFSTSRFDNNPLFSTSNDTLYFSSQRGGSAIFRVTRTAMDWTAPTAINIPYPNGYGTGNEFFITRNKTIYFALEALTAGGKRDIYKSRLVNGQYTQPESLGLPINTIEAEDIGYVDPDERFILYCGVKTSGFGYHDLYISSKNTNGSWNTPKHFETPINSANEDIAPYITPDGKYFFFNTWRTGDTGYTPYWADVKILDSYK